MRERTLKIVGQPEGTIEDGKRLYLPGVKIIADCPKCNRSIEHDMEDYYLAYPPMNAPKRYTIWCEDCNEEFSFNVRLNVSLELVTEK